MIVVVLLLLLLILLILLLVLVLVLVVVGNHYFFSAGLPGRRETIKEIINDFSAGLPAGVRLKEYRK